MHKRFFLIALALFGMLLTPASSFAGTASVSLPYVNAMFPATTIVLNTPNTYSQCVDATTFDTITVTGVGNYRLKGQIIVDYVTNSGRQTVQSYPVDQIGDLSLTVAYPAVSQWPVLTNGTREIHVDVQLELLYGNTSEYVYDSNGNQVTLGPGQDWDVFCLGTPPPPSGGQGCTPGYWKQSQHFDSWVTYTPTMSFNQVFGVGPNITLLQALQARGGGADALSRHATAALLNTATSGVSYKYTTAQVIQLVRDAYSNATTYEAAKDLLAGENERGCPLN
jgi:hypothetical protein